MRLAMDSSAAAKRYIDESRSVDVRNLLGAGHVVFVNRLVAVEVASALARRMRDGSLQRHRSGSASEP